MGDSSNKSRMRSVSEGNLAEEGRNKGTDYNPNAYPEHSSTLPRSLSFKKKSKTPKEDEINGPTKEKKKSKKSVGHFISKIIRHMSALTLNSGSSYNNMKHPYYNNIYHLDRNGDLPHNNYKYMDFKNKTPGLSGLRNHGNTCFMNAVLQCLSNTDILAEYFVLDQYRIDLSRKNKLNAKKFGTRGELTEQLAILLKSLWSCQYTPEISNQFKNVVGKYGTQYSGSNQHDAQEFLLWLLDKVHEDLNTATKRKYKTRKNSYGRSDDILASEALANHVRCNNSFVHDIFQAQYRSSLTCPNCWRQSNTFDPFLCVSLPLPQRHTCSVFVTVVYLRPDRPVQMKIGLNISVHATILQLREAISKETGIPANRIVLTELNSDGFQQTLSDNHCISKVRETDCLYAIEMPHVKPPNNNEGSEKLLLIFINKHGVGSQARKFGCPYVLLVSREITYEELQRTILQEMSGIVKAVVLSQKLGVVFRIRVVDGIPGKCYLPHDVDHPLYVQTVDRALSFYDDSMGPLHLKLVVEWDMETKACVITNTDDHIEEHSSVKQQLAMQCQPQTATLDECFQLYTQEEALGPEDAWLCPSCKKLQQGTVKKLSLWTVPDVLIIHLKRFRQSSSQRTKLNTLVEFPLMGLDMTPHLAQRNNNHVQHSGLSVLTHWSPWKRNHQHNTYHHVSSPEDNIYDLYAMCNHHGHINGGHYTAVCKNPTDCQWYSFDDIKVTPIKESEIDNRSAYLLFYSRRSLSPSLSSSRSSSSSGSEHWVFRMPYFNYTPPSSSKSDEHFNHINSFDSSAKPEAPQRGIRAYSSMGHLRSRPRNEDTYDRLSLSDEQVDRLDKYSLAESCV